MSWVKLSDGFVEDPVWEGLEPAAFMLHVVALSYSNRVLSDGFVGSSRVATLHPAVPDPMDQAAALVAAGLWTVEPGGYRVAEYVSDLRRGDGRGDEQPDAVTVRGIRKKAADRQARWRSDQARKKARNAGSNGVTDGVSHSAQTRPDNGGGRSSAPPCRHGRADGRDTDGEHICIDCAEAEATTTEPVRLSSPDDRSG